MKSDNQQQTEMKSKYASEISQQSSMPLRPKWKEVESALEDIKDAFGFTPSFINNLTDQSLPGAWRTARNMRFSSNTALDIKLKGLIALAVSAQIPCDLMSYYEQRATLEDGATHQEQLEAVLMASITRHWSALLNGSLFDKNEFKKEANLIFAYIRKMMDESRMVMPAEEMFLFKPTLSVDETYKDVEKIFGLVPKFIRLFPKEGIAAAWSEFKGLQLNPHTALSGKEKELIGLAISSQIPCEYCIYFHRNAAELNGASEREMQEAISIAALARHWSTLFHGPHIDPMVFREDAVRMIEKSHRPHLQ